jgi:hypothetical protein
MAYRFEQGRVVEEWEIFDSWAFAGNLESRHPKLTVW